MVSAKIHREILLPVLLGLFMITALFFVCADRTYAVDGVKYLDEDGKEQTANNCISIPEFEDEDAPTLGGEDGRESESDTIAKL